MIDSLEKHTACKILAEDQTQPKLNYRAAEFNREGKNCEIRSRVKTFQSF